MSMGQNNPYVQDTHGHMEQDELEHVLQFEPWYGFLKGAH